MDSFLKKVMQGDMGESVHDELIKYSKGVFENRYLVEGKKQKDKWAIKTSAEFANYFVRKCLEKTGGEIDIKGITVSTFDIQGELEFEVEKIKKYMGIQQCVIDTTTTSDKVLKVMDSYPKVFYALSFKTNDCELKVKAKPPKSGKPGKKGEDGPKADFCSLKTFDKEIIDDLFLGIPDFKEVKINHTIQIDSIEIPKDFEDPAEMREKAVRKGKIIRKINVDGREEIKEFEFGA